MFSSLLKRFSRRCDEAGLRLQKAFSGGLDQPSFCGPDLVVVRSVVGFSSCPLAMVLSDWAIASLERAGAGSLAVSGIALEFLEATAGGGANSVILAVRSLRSLLTSSLSPSAHKERARSGGILMNEGEWGSLSSRKIA